MNVEESISYSEVGNILRRILIHNPLNWNTETCYHEIRDRAAEMLKKSGICSMSGVSDIPPSFLTPVLPSPVFLFLEVNMREKRKRKCYTYLIRQ